MKKTASNAKLRHYLPDFTFTPLEEGQSSLYFNQNIYFMVEKSSIRYFYVIKQCCVRDISEAAQQILNLSNINTRSTYDNICNMCPERIGFFEYPRLVQHTNERFACPLRLLKVTCFCFFLLLAIKMTCDWFVTNNDIARSWSDQTLSWNSHYALVLVSSKLVSHRNIYSVPH